MSKAATVRKDAKVGRELYLPLRECFNQNGGGQGVLLSRLQRASFDY